LGGLASICEGHRVLQLGGVSDAKVVEHLRGERVVVRVTFGRIGKQQRQSVLLEVVRQADVRKAKIAHAAAAHFRVFFDLFFDD
jgi:hypothetical protein